MATRVLRVCIYDPSHKYTPRQVTLLRTVKTEGSEFVLCKCGGMVLDQVEEEFDECPRCHEAMLPMAHGVHRCFSCGGERPFTAEELGVIPVAELDATNEEPG